MEELRSMDITPYAIPAILALFAKATIYFYSKLSQTRNLQTRLYLLFLFALSIQNLAEITFFTAQARNLSAPAGGFTYFGASIVAIALLAHLASVLAVGKHVRQNLVVVAIYMPALLLEALLWNTNLLVSGFEPLHYTYTKIPGPFYFLFEIYALSYLGSVAVLLVYGSFKQTTSYEKAKNKLMLLGMIPIFLVVVTVIVLQHAGIRSFNTTVTLPIAVTFFLAVTAYATHQYRLFDIQFYIPWSEVRARKTAFYDRIRAMIAEIADLGSGSIGRALDRLADTLRCPVAFIDDTKAMVAAVGAPQMLGMPVDTLKHIDHIVVANEIVDTKQDIYAVMKQYGVAAIVPFHPHSHSAASWLLLGEAFSDQVYTPRDFRMVEQLFDKMADLFLDKLVAMRTQLADAHLQIQTLTFQLERAQVNTTVLEQRVETLGRENLRLVREQPADALLLTQRPATNGLAITLLGWNKAMRQRLRARFAQLEHFAGPDSSSFRRRRMPDVLLCEVDTDAHAAQRKLADLIADNGQRCAVLLFGSGATAFAMEYRKQLLGKPVEVLPPEMSDDAIERRVQALVRLRQSLLAAPYPEFPLLGCSGAYCEAIAEANRIAGFTDPICIKSADIDEAIAVGAYVHETSKSDGAFRILRTAKLLARENRTDDDEHAKREIETLLAEISSGTLMIDNLGTLPNELWDELLEKTNEFAGVRLIAACTPSSAQPPTMLFKPLRPLTLELPTLRERRQDLPLLVHYYTLQYNLQAGTQRYLSQADVDDLVELNYPADLQSLRTVVFDRLHTKTKEGERQPMEPPALTTTDPEWPPEKTLDEYVAEIEKRLIEQTLKRCNGNKSKTARLLGLRPNTLHYKLERYGLLAKKNC